MTDSESGAGDPSDEAKYLHYGMALLTAIESAFAPWLRATLEFRSGASLSAEVEAGITSAEERAIANITRLIEADVSEPLSGPLEQLRQAVGGIAPVLVAHDFPQPNRDPYDQEMRPDDIFDLGPISFMDLGEAVQTAGITWGAAKAHLHMTRRAT